MLYIKGVIKKEEIMRYLIILFLLTACSQTPLSSEWASTVDTEGRIFVYQSESCSGALCPPSWEERASFYYYED
jgi:hypothetical protein